MSPSVRLVCYPRGDGTFNEHAQLTLRIDLPDSYSAEDLVAEVQRRLRDSYPLAAIHVEPGKADGPPTWHVHRDGAPVN
jgi:hypothetical protein